VFLLCVLSHGKNGEVFGSDCEPVKIEELETYFDGEHCDQLIARPKLFLIQACQGGSFNSFSSRPIVYVV